MLKNIALLSLLTLLAGTAQAADTAIVEVPLIWGPGISMWNSDTNPSSWMPSVPGEFAFKWTGTPINSWVKFTGQTGNDKDKCFKCTIALTAGSKTPTAADSRVFVLRVSYPQRLMPDAALLPFNFFCDPMKSCDDPKV